MTDTAPDLRRLMRRPEPRHQEDWRIVLRRHLMMAKAFDPLALPDHELERLAAGVDKRRCQGMRLRDNMDLAYREVQSWLCRQAADRFDADNALTKAERRERRRRGRP